MISTTAQNAASIQRGEVTHHHDQVMTLHHFRTTNTAVSPAGHPNLNMILLFIFSYLYVVHFHHQFHCPFWRRGITRTLLQLHVDRPQFRRKFWVGHLAILHVVAFLHILTISPEMRRKHQGFVVAIMHQYCHNPCAGRQRQGGYSCLQAGFVPLSSQTFHSSVFCPLYRLRTLISRPWRAFVSFLVCSSFGESRAWKGAESNGDQAFGTRLVSVLGI